MLDAKNLSIRLNDSAHLEEEFVRFYIARFTALNVNLNQAIQLSGPSKTNNRRTRRNIIGNLLSSLTGLVTHEGNMRIL